MITTSPDRERLRPTSTTAAPRPDVVSPIPDIEPSLIGLPYEIVTEDGLGNLRFIDLASNTMTTIDAPRGGDMGRLFAGNGWVLIPNGSTERALAYRDGNSDPYWVNDFSAWNVLHAQGAATMWQSDEALSLAGPGNMIELDPTGAPTGVTVPVPRVPVHVDADGTFLVEMPGGAFAIGPAGSTRLTTGDVVALGPTVALVHECDESMTCTYWVVDRTSGERRELPAVLDGIRLEPIGWWPTSATISPDGMLAFVLVPVTEGVGRNRFVAFQPTLINLVSATSAPLDIDPLGWLSGAQWTSDSQFAMFLAEGELNVYSRASGTLLPVWSGARPIRAPQQFAVRPADGTPWSDR